ncbi:MAG: cytochrome c biogenesis protein ResB [bacterium]|nr:cytochrome c biogenesis protein ResB [bacterium]
MPERVARQSGPIRNIFRFLGSLKLAVVLLAVSIVVLAVATFVESERGLDVAQWYVYDAPWFIALACVLATNLLVATLLRLPWKRRHIGFLLTHYGLLVLLAGSLLTYFNGVEGQLTFVEGKEADTILLAGRSQLTTRWHDEKPNTVDFRFVAGPVDWPDGKTKKLGELDGVRVDVLEFYPHAEGDGPFQPVEVKPDQKYAPSAGALFEVTVAGDSQRVWLRHNIPRVINTPKGRMLLSFGDEESPLDFSLKLLEFQHGKNPGGMGDASFASSVKLVDVERGVVQEHVISMNDPLTYGKFTFYQSSFRSTAEGKDVSILTATYDPGRSLKYLGCLVTCVGTFMMFYLRRSSSSKALPAALPHTTRPRSGPAR